MLRHDGDRIVAHEGRPPAHHLVQHGAESVEVGPRVRLAAERLLGRHVADGAEDRPGRGQALKVERDREAEVSELGGPVVREPHVPRLHVTVHDAVTVGVVERAAYLLRDPHGLGHRQALARRAVQALREISARHVLEDQERPPVLVADVVDADDVRMIAEPAHRRRFAPHAREDVRAEAPCLDQRDRHRAVDAHVVAKVDDLLPAFAEVPTDDVASPAEVRRDVTCGLGPLARVARRRDAVAVARHG